MKSIRIVGTGRALPSFVLTNAELERRVQTTDAWIVERTGIRERRIVDAATATSDLVAEALLGACRGANVRPADLDAIIVATSTPDTVYPSTGCWVQKRLGISGMPAFDISAGCSGFLFALENAANMITAGSARKVLVAGGEVMSKVVDNQDRATCVLFGDGAGAALVVAGDGASGILSSNWGCDGTLAPLLFQPAGGTRLPTSEETVRSRQQFVHMAGNQVFRHAVRTMSDAALKAVNDAGFNVEDVDLLIPHQANTRIMDATLARVGIQRERMYVIVDRYGNMSAASIPVAIDEARREGRLKDGDVLLLTAFGTGFTWAASLLRW